MEKIVDIIKYEGDNSTFIWKHPCEDFNTMTQLIVHESQEAIFFMNGQALDLFGPGRHTLETQNIPEIGKAIKKATSGETPFHCEVYFINKTVQMGFKWGTPDRVRFIEPTLQIPFEIGASGEMNLAVSDSRKLLVKLVGTMNGIAWGDRGAGFTKSIESSFRPLIVTAVKSHLASCIKTQNINLLEIDEHLEEISELMRQKLLSGFEEYGLTVPQFYISTILLPENDPNFKKVRELHTISLQTKMAEAEATIVKARRGVALEESTTETELLKLQAERDLIKAQTEAQAAKMAGFAEAEIMHAQGYNQKDVIQAEVQKAYAAGIGNMNISGGGAGDIVGLGVGLAAASAIAPQVGEMFNGMGVNNAQNTVPSASVIEQKCAKCGSVLPENAKFCLECGEKVVAPTPAGMVVCSKCGNTVAKGKFCPECGHKFLTNCPKCGVELSNSAKFCPECGEKL